MASLGAGAFLGCASLKALALPSTVTSLGYEAFAGCPGLTGVFFAGDAPATVNSAVFSNSTNATAYYSVKTTGWGPTLSDAPAVEVSTPVFVQPPASQAVLAGSKVTFQASAFGPPPLSYQWQFDGGDISGAKSSSYTLASVQTKNAGDYTVVVANSYGSVTSAPAMLSLADIAGTYRGRIATGNSPDAAGAFALAVTSSGAFSARLTFHSQAISASGRFALDDRQPATATTRFTGQIGDRPVEVRLTVALDGSAAVSGSVTVAGDPSPAAQLQGARLGLWKKSPANEPLIDAEGP